MWAEMGLENGSPRPTGRTTSRLSEKRSSGDLTRSVGGQKYPQQASVSPLALSEAAPSDLPKLPLLLERSRLSLNCWAPLDPPTASRASYWWRAAEPRPDWTARFIKEPLLCQSTREEKTDKNE